MVTVCALLSPSERPRLEAAGAGRFTALYVDSCRDAMSALRHRPVDALILSVHSCRRDDLPMVARLVRAFPAVPAVALLSRHDPEGTELLPHLGASGVRAAVDCTAAAGWCRLRDLVLDAASEVAAPILARVAPALGDGSPALGDFFAPLARRAPELRTLGRLARALALRPTTLRSRFARVGLPSPKVYLVEMRLLHAAYHFGRSGITLTDVAYRLNCDSPRGFARQLKRWAGLTVAEFRRGCPFDRWLARYVDCWISPYRETLRAFSPVSADAAPRPHAARGSGPA
ncbi:MAG TPA: AraC family transcriptional regulator [Gemmatimonadales bacterium]|nr:AraC family transcriptional regulator [Gemmatimonadales bacterium]